jgi:hypothetical protein
MRVRMRNLGKNLPDPLMPWDKKVGYVFRTALSMTVWTQMDHKTQEIPSTLYAQLNLGIICYFKLLSVRFFHSNLTHSSKTTCTILNRVLRIAAQPTAWNEWIPE